MRKTPWPRPHDEEHLFAKALLIHGPFPEKGWGVTRDKDNIAHYIVPRSNEARSFSHTISREFTDEVARRYRLNGWSQHHCQMVGKSWKNIFLRWVWRHLDVDRR